MSKLEVGDRVLTSQDESSVKIYEQVYAFGHRHQTFKASFIKFRVATGKWIEMTGAHLIHVQGKVHPVRADAVKVGDRLVGVAGGDLKVTEIRQVTKTGIYAPLTPSGNIAVNGILASSYVSLQENANEYAKLGNTDIILSQAGMSHLWLSPFRMICTVSGQSYEICRRNDDNGLSPWVAVGFQYVKWGETQNIFIQAILLLATLAVLVFVNGMEALTKLPLSIAAFVVLAALLNRHAMEVRATLTFGSARTKQKRM